ncbi:hypothetical protein GCM10010353_60710 [Streptomyces chryseus]|nr:hypothetical protein GCM10010353_60710 [Streptomyces chryseus]
MWFDRPETEAPAWYRAHTHPVAGEALRLFHEDPAMARVAAEVGVSRAIRRPSASATPSARLR